MMRSLSQSELRDHTAEIMDALDRGEDFLVTRDGVPIGELRPLRRTFVPRDLLLEPFRTAPPIDAGRLGADLDTAGDQGVEPVA